jgi:hypothetical protein
MMIPPQIPSAAWTEAVLQQLQGENRRAQAAELVASARPRGDLPARGRGVGIDRARMAQEEAKTVSGLCGKHEAARRGKIECARVRRKFADDGRKCAALERFGKSPERILDMTDAHVHEMHRPYAQLRKAGGIRGGTFPCSEVVLDIKDVTARLGGASGKAEGKTRSGSKIAGRRRQDLVHGLAIEPAAESLVDGLNPELNRRPWRFAAVAGAARLYGRNGLP